MKRFGDTPHRESAMGNSNKKKERLVIGIDYVGDGMYSMLMIKNGDMIPLRSSEKLTYLFWLASDRTDRENILISDSVKEVLTHTRNAPDISDIKVFTLE